VIGAFAAFYGLAAAVAALAGASYVVSALFAALIPLSAALLLLATARMKTERDRDVSVDDQEDPAPGIGMDDATPLGDTPEHSDADA
jgi:hypothetical protein